MNKEIKNYLKFCGNHFKKVIDKDRKEQKTSLFFWIVSIMCFSIAMNIIKKLFL